MFCILNEFEQYGYCSSGCVKWEKKRILICRKEVPLLLTDASQTEALPPDTDDLPHPEAGTETCSISKNEFPVRFHNNCLRLKQYPKMTPQSDFMLTVWSFLLFIFSGTEGRDHGLETARKDIDQDPLQVVIINLDILSIFI